MTFFDTYFSYGERRKGIRIWFRNNAVESFWTTQDSKEKFHQTKVKLKRGRLDDEELNICFGLSRKDYIKPSLLMKWLSESWHWNILGEYKKRKVIEMMIIMMLSSWGIKLLLSYKPNRTIITTLFDFVLCYLLTVTPCVPRTLSMDRRRV